MSARETFKAAFEAQDSYESLIGELLELSDDWSRLIKHFQSNGNMDWHTYHTCQKQLDKIIAKHQQNG